MKSDCLESMTLMSYLPLQALLITAETHQRCRVKLRDHMVQKGSKMSRASLEQLDTLEAATLAIHLRHIRAV